MAKANDGADTLKQFDARLRTVEEFHQKLKWTGVAIKALWAGVGITFFAALGLAFWLGSTYTAITKDVDAHAKQITDLETQSKELHKDLTDKNEAMRKDVNEKNEALVKAIKILQQNVVVLFDRHPKGGPPNVPQAVVFQGAIKSVSAKEITILPPELGEPAIQFTIPSNLEITVNGKPAKSSELQVGMNASVLTIGNSIEWIHAE